jgi:hypothetical protein
MPVTEKESGRLDADDRAALRLGAHRIFDGGLCCGIEVQRDDGVGRWELQVLVLRGGTVEQVEEAADASVRLDPGAPLRLSGYLPDSLGPARDLSPVVCHGAEGDGCV